MKTKTRDYFYYILLVMPFVDLITGWTLNSKSGGILTYVGQLYRFSTFFYMFYILYGRRIPKKMAWLLLLTDYLGIFAIIDTLRFDVSLFENISSTMKFLFPVYMTYCLVESEQKNNGLTEKILNVFSWIYPLSFDIPRLLGTGYYLRGYAFESGYKGFYFATNEQNVVIVVLFVYEFHKLYNNLTYSRKSSGHIHFDMVNIVKLFLIISALLLIGTKTSIFAIAIVCLLYLFKRGSLIKKTRFLGLFCITGITVGTLIVTTLSSQLENMTYRITYNYNRFIVEESGLLTFFLSKRNLRIEPATEYWYTNKADGIFNFLFGVGKAVKCPDNGIGVNPFALIEMDFFDCLFWFGIIATIIMLIFYVSFFFRKANGKDLFMEKVMLSLILGFSMLAGHVLVSPTSGSVFAIVLARLYLNSKNLKQGMKMPIYFCKGASQA